MALGCVVVPRKAHAASVKPGATSVAPDRQPRRGQPRSGLALARGDHMNIRELTASFIASLPQRSDEELDASEARIRSILRRPKRLSPGYRKAAEEALAATVNERLRRAFR